MPYNSLTFTRYQCCFRLVLVSTAVFEVFLVNCRSPCWWMTSLLSYFCPFGWEDINICCSWLAINSKTTVVRETLTTLPVVCCEACTEFILAGQGIKQDFRTKLSDSCLLSWLNAKSHLVLQLQNVSQQNVSDLVAQQELVKVALDSNAFNM